MWQRLVGAVLELRVVVVLLGVLFVGAGLIASPFDLPTGPLPREPVAVDAIPDIGENQQIVFSEWPGRSPRDVEDQVTYPLTSALLGIPGVRTVRSSSALGFSSIYVIFEDDVDFWWSRSRVLERLASLPPDTVPDDVHPTLGPDATALGQVFWYTLEGRSPEGEPVGGWDPDELRSIQDWTVRRALQSVPGVSEVASVGGFVREYQVDVDPEAMRAHGVSIGQVADAVRRSNLDVGARTLEINAVEYLVRGVGFVEGVEDLEQTVVAAREHTPVRVQDVARVGLGPALRRGALDDAGAPAVGGVVVARYLENPVDVIDGVKERLAELQPGMPRRVLADGTVSQVTVVPFYDRTELIADTLGTLSRSLAQQMLITALVVLVMLRNLRSSLLVTAVLPLGVLGSFAVMKALGVSANAMALAGIAIAIGTMVDIAIVFVESITARVEDASDRATAIREAVIEVAPAVSTSVLTTIVSFLPVFGLTDAEYRLFAPLAVTKTAAMAVALVLALSLLPAAALWLFGPRERLALRHLALLVLGLVALSISPLGGALVIGLALWQLAQPWLSEAAVQAGATLELPVTAVVLAALLTAEWLPLGPAVGLLLNGLFVALVVGAVLGSFVLFEGAYPRLLATFLERREVFLALPVAIVAFGGAAWLGVEPVVRHLPESLQTSRPVSALTAAFPGLGREYMPPFDEGAFLYMPTTMPHASIGEAQRMLSDLDAAIASIPEVDRVVGKLGRVESALDPAPVSMIETVVTYVPEYRTEEDGTRVRQWRDHIRSSADIWEEITDAASLPGLTRAPVLMPINARVVMLQSGMRAPLGLKLTGPDLATLEAFGSEVQALLREVPSIRSETVFADRVVGKPYLEVVLDREAIGRYGLTVVDVQRTLQVALGGITLTHTVEGRERYPVRVRYMREDRDSVEALERVFVTTSTGEPIPLTQVADLRYVRGPQVIKSEDTFLTSYVLFDRVPEVSEVEVVEDARALLDERIASGALVVPEGVGFTFAGSYTSQLRSEARLRVLIPVAVILVILLLHLQFRRLSTTVIIGSGVLVAAGGGLGLVWLYNVPGFLDVGLGGASLAELLQIGPLNLSVAVWVGMLALIGVATDDGVVMATLLDQRFAAAPPRTVEEVRDRVLEAGSRRIRACLMTTATTLLALLPVITSTGRGSDLMVPLAVPMIGGMAVALVTLFVVPVLYAWVAERELSR